MVRAVKTPLLFNFKCIRFNLRKKNKQKPFLKIKNIPSSTGAQRKQCNHASVDVLKVEQLINACVILDVHEKIHAKYAIDKHDQEEQEANVQQGGH